MERRRRKRSPAEEKAYRAHYTARTRLDVLAIGISKLFETLYDAEIYALLDSDLRPAMLEKERTYELWQKARGKKTPPKKGTVKTV